MMRMKLFSWTCDASILHFGFLYYQMCPWLAFLFFAVNGLFAGGGGASHSFIFTDRRLEISEIWSQSYAVSTSMNLVVGVTVLGSIKDTPEKVAFNVNCTRSISSTLILVGKFFSTIDLRLSLVQLGKMRFEICPVHLLCWL